MSTESASLGDNGRAALQTIARRLTDVLDQIADLQEQAKTIKAEAKGDGYDLKALGQIVREMRRGPDYQVAQLELELVLDTYRRAAGLPTSLDAAQEAAAEAAGALPAGAEDALSHPGLDGASIDVDGEWHALGQQRRRKRRT